MNRGRARQNIFHGSAYYELFLSTLAEAHQRFGVEILCYCLMGNHYHLLLKTPDANLGRVMRHKMVFTRNATIDSRRPMVLCFEVVIKRFASKMTAINYNCPAIFIGIHWKRNWFLNWKSTLGLVIPTTSKGINNHRSGFIPMRCILRWALDRGSRKNIRRL